jgi:hypothetical protein
MKTIQEELGGVSQENGGDACKIKTKKWDEKTQNFEELSKCVESAKLLILGFKEIIWSFY